MNLAEVSPDDKNGITFPSNATRLQAPWWTGNKIKLPPSLFSGDHYSIIEE